MYCALLIIFGFCAFLLYHVPCGNLFSIVSRWIKGKALKKRKSKLLLLVESHLLLPVWNGSHHIFEWTVPVWNVSHHISKRTVPVWNVSHLQTDCASLECVISHLQTDCASLECVISHLRTDCAKSRMCHITSANGLCPSGTCHITSSNGLCPSGMCHMTSANGTCGTMQQDPMATHVSKWHLRHHAAGPHGYSRQQMAPAAPCSRTPWLLTSANGTCGTMQQDPMATHVSKWHLRHHAAGPHGYSRQQMAPAAPCSRTPWLLTSANGTCGTMQQDPMATHVSKWHLRHHAAGPHGYSRQQMAPAAPCSRTPWLLTSANGTCGTMQQDPMATHVSKWHLRHHAAGPHGYSRQQMAPAAPCSRTPWLLTSANGTCGTMQQDPMATHVSKWHLRHHAAGPHGYSRQQMAPAAPCSRTPWLLTSANGTCGTMQQDPMATHVSKWHLRHHAAGPHGYSRQQMAPAAPCSRTPWLLTSANGTCGTMQQDPMATHVSKWHLRHHAAGPHGYSRQQMAPVAPCSRTPWLLTSVFGFLVLSSCRASFAAPCACSRISSGDRLSGNGSKGVPLYGSHERHIAKQPFFTTKASIIIKRERRSISLRFLQINSHTVFNSIWTCLLVTTHSWVGGGDRRWRGRVKSVSQQLCFDIRRELGEIFS